MKHLGTMELETERLTLRRVSINDAKQIFDNWACDVEVTKYLTWPAHSSLEVTERVINMWIDGYNNEDFYQWLIVEKATNEPLGTISVVDKDDTVEKFEIGYCIGRKWWNKGFTSEAFSRVIKFLFEEVKTNKVEARHALENDNSGKVMIKCGLKHEGTLRDSAKNNQGICTMLHYGILAREYFNMLV